MKKLSIFILPILIFAISSCKTDSNNHDNHDDSHATWSYEGETGPEHWAEISDEHADCAGKSQSPINIVGAVKGENLKPLFLDYSAKANTEVVNNGHTIKVNYDAGTFVIEDPDTYDGIDFNIAQFHFHCGSENTVDGKRYPSEAHFVHVDKDGNLAVLALFIEEGEENEFLAKVLEVAPKEGSSKIEAEININNFLPESKSYWAFSGSLTTPPCSEGVKWYVLKESVQASKEQIEKLASLMPANNYRPVQDLNGRTIYEF